MRASLILQTATKILFPLILLMSVFIFWRGHNLPGGGFIGGLVASCAFLLYALAWGVQRARAVLRIDTQKLLALGLLFAALSGFLGIFQGRFAFLVGAWVHEVPIFKHLGSPIIFDLGVYLLVLGFGLHVLFALLEEAEA